MKNLCFIPILFIFCALSFGQDGFSIQNNKKSDKVHFKLLNNLIVIPVEINGVELSFLLDTGVSKPIIFNFFNISDSLKFKETETIFLRGLGEGEPVKASKSENNIFRIGEALNLNQDLYAVYNADLNLAPRLGVPIHGIIGFDLLKDLVVEVNYARRFIRLTEPEFHTKRYKNFERIHLEFYNNKPYINTNVVIDETEIPVKLLIDSGGSDSLWLFENDSLGISSGERYFDDFLGHGLSGSVFGKRARVKRFFLGKYALPDANVAYPDSSSIFIAKNNKKRNGSLSGNILKRFNVVFNYPRAMIMFKRNSHFREPFSYNRSGIELAHEGVRIVKEIDEKAKFNDDSSLHNNQTVNQNRIVLDEHYRFSLKPAYTVVELREHSPAAEAGVKIGDIILSINGKQAHQYTLQKLMYKFYEDVGKRIKLKIERKGTVLSYTFKLEEPY